MCIRDRFIYCKLHIVAAMHPYRFLLVVLVRQRNEDFLIYIHQSLIGCGILSGVHKVNASFSNLILQNQRLSTVSFHKHLSLIGFHRTIYKNGISRYGIVPKVIQILSNQFQQGMVDIGIDVYKRQGQ